MNVTSNGTSTSFNARNGLLLLNHMTMRHRAPNRTECTKVSVINICLFVCLCLFLVIIVLSSVLLFQRALFIMESLLRSDVPDVVSHFDVALQDLTDLTSSPNFSIKAKANKVSLYSSVEWTRS